MTQGNPERSFNMPRLLRAQQRRDLNADRTDGVWTSLSNDDFFQLIVYVKAYTDVSLSGAPLANDAANFDACQRTVDALQYLLGCMNRCAPLRMLAERVVAGEAQSIPSDAAEQAWSAAFANAPVDDGFRRLLHNLKLAFGAWLRRNGDESLDGLVRYSIAPTGQDTELSFSGGGMRAAAFSLGVLLYVIDAGALGRVRQISSVSGGSLTNGFVANSMTASGDTTPSETTLSDFARRLSEAGMPLERGGRLVVMQLAVAAISIVVAVIALVAAAAVESHFADLRLVGGFTALSVLCGWSAYMTFRRTTDSLIGGWFAHTINDTRLGMRRIRPADLLPFRLSRAPFNAPNLCRRRLRDVKSPIVHVFTATDLRNGEHFHFSQSWTASNTFGTADPGDIWLDEAVRASAAFPGALPPVKLKLDRLRLASDRTVGQRHLELVDGGVRDNLGHTFQTRLQPEHSEEREVLTAYREGGLHIVVDASAPRGVSDMSESLLARIPILRRIEQIVTFPRVIGIMNQSNSEARALALARRFSQDGEGIVVQVRNSPVDACRHAIDEPTVVADLLAGRDRSALPATSRRRRAEAALRALVRVDPATVAKWNGQRNLNASIATTLDALGEQRVAGLLRHGYVLAMCMAHIEFEWPLLPDHLWLGSRFERMTSVPPAGVRPGV